MEGFSQPTPKPQIAKPVPIEQTDSGRQNTYNELLKTAKTLEAPLTDTAASTLPLSPSTVQPAIVIQPISDQDKKNFLRAILGGKDYEKKYKLFDNIDVSMSDRSVELTERMYNQLEEDQKNKKIKIETDEGWDVWTDRYQMAAVVRAVTGLQGGEQYPIPENFFDRVQVLMRFPKPVYSALMETTRKFEDHVETLTSKAQEPDFWRAGGKSLR